MWLTTKLVGVVIIADSSSSNNASSSTNRTNWWSTCISSSITNPTGRADLDSWCIPASPGGLIPLTSVNLGLPCNLNRSRSSPARVNPFGYIQLTGSWTNLINNKPVSTSSAGAASSGDDYATYSAQEFSELKACSCEFWHCNLFDKKQKVYLVGTFLEPFNYY